MNHQYVVSVFRQGASNDVTLPTFSALRCHTKMEMATTCTAAPLCDEFDVTPAGTSVRLIIKAGSKEICVPSLRSPKSPYS